MLEISAVIFFTLLGIIIQRIIGFGAGLVLTPVLLIYFNPPLAVSIVLFVGIISSLIFLYMDRFKLELSWPIVLRLVVTAVPGIMIGSYIVTQIDKSMLQIIVGLLIIVSVLVQEYAFPKPTKPLTVSKGINLTGFLAGVLNAAAAMAPIPMLLWMRSHVTTPNQIRHNLAAIFILMNTVSIITIYFFKPHSFDTEVLSICLLMIPVILLGNILGMKMAANINTMLYHKIIFVAIIIAGLTSIALGAKNLL